MNQGIIKISTTLTSISVQSLCRRSSCFLCESHAVEQERSFFLYVLCLKKKTGRRANYLLICRGFHTHTHTYIHIHTQKRNTRSYSSFRFTIEKHNQTLGVDEGSRHGPIRAREVRWSQTFEWTIFLGVTTWRKKVHYVMWKLRNLWKEPQTEITFFPFPPCFSHSNSLL